MATAFPQQYYNDREYIDELDYSCRHRNVAGECEQCDEEIESRGGIDKCLNCGRYQYNDSLNRDQVCVRGCVNPNEY